MSVHRERLKYFKVLVITTYKTRRETVLSSSPKRAVDSVRARLGHDMDHAKVVIDSQTTFGDVDNDRMYENGTVVDGTGRIIMRDE